MCIRHSTLWSKKLGPWWNTRFLLSPAKQHIVKGSIESWFVFLLIAASHKWSDIMYHFVFLTTKGQCDKNCVESPEPHPSADELKQTNPRPNILPVTRRQPLRHILSIQHCLLVTDPIFTPRGTTVFAWVRGWNLKLFASPVLTSPATRLWSADQLAVYFGLGSTLRTPPCWIRHYRGALVSFWRPRSGWLY